MSVLATANENGGAVGSSDGTGMDFDPSVTASHSHLGHMEGKEEARGGGGEEVDKENKGHSKQRETNLSPELNRHESVVAADAQQQLHQVGSPMMHHFTLVEMQAHLTQLTVPHDPFHFDN